MQVEREASDCARAKYDGTHQTTGPSMQAALSLAAACSALQAAESDVYSAKLQLEDATTNLGDALYERKRAAEELRASLLEVRNLSVGRTLAADEAMWSDAVRDGMAAAARECERVGVCALHAVAYSLRRLEESKADQL